LKYYDLNPPPGNTSLTLEVDRDFSGLSLGDDESQGKTFSYNFKVTNTKLDKGLLMTVLVFKVPSCLEINFNQLRLLKDTLKFDYYEVLHSNTEIVLYWRQMMPGEVKEVKIDLLQQFAGTCYEPPNFTYLYYNND
jgi:hypothetical protein